MSTTDTPRAAQLAEEYRQERDEALDLATKMRAERDEARRELRDVRMLLAAAVMQAGTLTITEKSMVEVDPRRFVREPWTMDGRIVLRYEAER